MSDAMSTLATHVSVDKSGPPTPITTAARAGEGGAWAAAASGGYVTVLRLIPTTASPDRASRG
jgi:hypothetical protein